MAFPTFYLLRVPPMEVERFKHRQLAPTVGPSSSSSGEFEGLHREINLVRRREIQRTHRSHCSCRCVKESCIHTQNRRQAVEVRSSPTVQVIDPVEFQFKTNSVRPPSEDSFRVEKFPCAHGIGFESEGDTTPCFPDKNRDAMQATRQDKFPCKKGRILSIMLYTHTGTYQASYKVPA
jgi:hypothetical protein